MVPIPRNSGISSRNSWLLCPLIQQTAASFRINRRMAGTTLHPLVRQEANSRNPVTNLKWPGNGLHLHLLNRGCSSAKRRLGIKDYFAVAISDSVFSQDAAQCSGRPWRNGSRGINPSAVSRALSDS